MNRRLPQDGQIVMADNPSGSIDRRCPCCVRTPAGKLLAVLFGCACHNTTLTGRDNVIAGDYAGFAQEQLRPTASGSQAMFLSGCGADANPSPRGPSSWPDSMAPPCPGSERVLAGPLLPISSDSGDGHSNMRRSAVQSCREEIQERDQLAFGGSRHGRPDAQRAGAGGRCPTLPSAARGLAVGIGDLTLVALPAEPVADYVACCRSLGARDRSGWRDSITIASAIFRPPASSRTGARGDRSHALDLGRSMQHQVGLLHSGRRSRCAERRASLGASKRAGM